MEEVEPYFTEKYDFEYQNISELLSFLTSFDYQHSDASIKIYTFFHLIVLLKYKVVDRALMEELKLIVLDNYEFENQKSVTVSMQTQKNNKKMMISQQFSSFKNFSIETFAKGANQVVLKKNESRDISTFQRFPSIKIPTEGKVLVFLSNSSTFTKLLIETLMEEVKQMVTKK